MILTAPEADVDYYPSSDGKPMADSATQYKWITVVKGGLDAVFRDDPDVLVCGNQLWYPVRGRRKICAAPDAMVIFGRPKREPKSYLQFAEDNIPPQVVFEIYSESNDAEELQEKFEFYQRYGVEEYYIYDPYQKVLEGWRRAGQILVPIPDIGEGYTSPRLGVHFRVDPEWILTGPDGRAFKDYKELFAECVFHAARAEAEAKRADEADRLKDEADRRANDEAKRAEDLDRELRALRAAMQSRDPNTADSTS